MRILRKYVWDTIRQNKRSSAVIITALFFMTVLMSCFCGLVYTMWTDAVVLEKWHEGDWHGELFDNTRGEDLEFIQNYASVSAVLVKGEWETAKVADEGRRLYLVSRGANQEYWDSMPEKDSITEGRPPKTENEIVLSKQFFEDFPDTQVGDTITLPVGQRTVSGEACMETEGYHEGEVFVETGTKTYQIVGSMDVTTSSSVPAYTGMTWLAEESIQPDDLITVYLRFSPMRSTYQELPALAAAIGYDMDEYGEYQLRYHTGLLSIYGIFQPSEKGLPIRLDQLLIPIMFLMFAGCLVAVFVLVIHNAFVMSVNQKQKQIGILASIGTSPKQIRKMVQTEALLLTCVPLLFGIFVGWILDLKLFALINASNDIGREAPDIVVTFGFPAVLPAILLSLLTAWISARIPAKKTARLMPMEILKQEGEIKKKKGKRKTRRFLNGIVGELASNAVSARKTSYRMATISLCMSFLLLSVFQYIVTIKEANDEIFRSSPDEEGHIFLSISDGELPDEEALQAVKQVPAIERAVLLNELYCAVWAEEEEISEEINTYMGGMEEIIAQKRYSPIKRDGKYRIQSVIIGLEEDSFRDYCSQLDIAPEPYFQDSSRALVYNYTKDLEASTRRNVLYRELLKLKKEQNLELIEKNTDDIEGDFTFPITVGDLVDRLPMENLGLSNFTLVMVMPMEHVLELGNHCCERRQGSSRSITGIFWMENEGTEGLSYTDIAKLTEKIEACISSYYASGDYLVSDLAEREEMNQSAMQVMNLVITFLTLFLAVIGLSNVWASISGNLRQRRQEFAMLKSVGLSPGQLWKLLLLEGLTLGLKPLLFSLPIQAVVLGVQLFISQISVAEYLPYAPFGVLLGYTCLILLAIISAYALGGRKLQRESMAALVKDDTL